MQAIADIIVKSSSDIKVQDLQLSNNNFTTLNSSNSISFAEMVNQQKQIDSETSKIAEDEAVPVVYESNEESVVEKTEDTQKTAANEKEENVSERKELPLEKKNVVLDKAEQPADVKDKAKITPKTDSSKKEIKAKNKLSEEEIKTLDKDFARFNEIIDSEKMNVNVEEQITVAEAMDIPLQNNAELDFNQIENSEINVANLSETGSVELKKDNFKFDNETGKISKLDKDGKILVKDLRTEKEVIQEPQKKNTGLETKIEITDENTATITMDLAGQAAETDILSLNNQTAASDGSNFQAMLNNQIQQNAPDFVRAGSIILKDKDQGTINLVLHPDDLGNVKIQLSLDGKTVSAHITVNTKEAMEVFKDNAQTLREAFAQNGFDTSNFDVSYNNSNGQNNQNFENHYDGTEFMAKRAYSDFDGGENGYVQEYFSENNSEYSVNIVA